jgi:hypothetical protein
MPARLDHGTPALLHTGTHECPHAWITAHPHSFIPELMNARTPASRHTGTHVSMHAGTPAHMPTGTPEYRHTGPHECLHACITAHRHACTHSRRYTGTPALRHEGIPSHMHSGTHAHRHAGIPAHRHCATRAAVYVALINRGAARQSDGARVSGDAISKRHGHLRDAGLDRKDRHPGTPAHRHKRRGPDQGNRRAGGRRIAGITTASRMGYLCMCSGTVGPRHSGTHVYRHPCSPAHRHAGIRRRSKRSIDSDTPMRRTPHVPQPSGLGAGQGSQKLQTETPSHRHPRTAAHRYCPIRSRTRAPVHRQGARDQKGGVTRRRIYADHRSP